MCIIIDIILLKRCFPVTVFTLITVTRTTSCYSKKSIMAIISYLLRTYPLLRILLCPTTVLIALENK